jgi:CoA:oxalate CoA-transferase
MPGPLESIKVLSFAKALAGPYASMLLCDLGAELFKIEGPQSGDMPRQNGPFIQGISSYFLSVNRGQKSITLDLRDDRVKKMIFELVKQVDIWVENFRPGAMSRLGLSYEVISRINPKIIYSSVSGFGQKGPYKLGPAFDMIAQGMGGTVIITGEPGRPPVRVGYSIGDIGAALFSALAILAALHEQEKSGKGNGCRGGSSSGGKVEGGGNTHEIFTHPLQNRKSLPRCRRAFDGGFQRHVGNFY